MGFNRDQIKAAAAALAHQGVFIGTSSWKYPGWLGQLYDQSRYVWHGRYSESRLQRLCLIEYAEVFKTVCVDAAYYKFPETRSLEDLASQVPADFQFAFKVTDQITLKRFTNLPRFGPRAGQVNPDFLNADLFKEAVLGPHVRTFHDHVGCLVFEFQAMRGKDLPDVTEWVEQLDEFLSALPRDVRYAVELRNPELLDPLHGAVLARHGVAHVFNSWTEMPPIGAQLELPWVFPTDFLVARALLRPGRAYTDAVKLFEPYDRVREPNPELRSDLLRLIDEATRRRIEAFVLANNRAEGNAPGTIRALASALAGES